MSLVEIGFSSVIDTSSTDIISQFFIPALENSIRYDRGVGYFSSTWLRLTARGMARFATNGGHARWIVSPILSKSDWEALEIGDEARSNLVLRDALARNISELGISLEEDTLSALAWMVADDIVEFKLAVPTNKLSGGDFHDKFGRLEDTEGNQVCFIGSHNESLQGTINSESFSLFASWQGDTLRPYLNSISARFEKLWANEDPNVRVYNLPEAARDQILQLRTDVRPYLLPDIDNFQRLSNELSRYRPSRLAVPPSIELRDYQEEAIGLWFANDCLGLLEMATGTGKTITALAASVRLFEREQRLAVIILAPYQHLVDQWAAESSKFGHHSILAYRGQQYWRDLLAQRVYSYNQGNIPSLTTITTHATFTTDVFQETISRLKGPVLIIADEVHHLGSKTRRNCLPQQVPYRLALSATPDRWFDDVGTAALRSYFGSTVFELSLAQAIGISLTPYYYHPVLVELTEVEMGHYRALSTKIARLFAKGSDLDDEQLGSLLRRRSNLLNSATNKLARLSELVDQQKQVKHTLFYCSPQQIDDVVQLLGWEKRLLVHRFTAQEDIPTRLALLERFDKEELDALVAMRCLDEGVDVPSTRTAYILASSGNPREFIQRRGRVLRKYPGKEYAVLYDLIAVPPLPSFADVESLNAERSILRRELKRFAEFADSSQNARQAYAVIWHLADQFGVLDFE